MTWALRFTSFVYIYVVVVNKAARFLWITPFSSTFTEAWSAHKPIVNMWAPEGEPGTTLAGFAGRSSCPVYAHSEYTGDSCEIRQVIHRPRWIACRGGFLAELTLSQRPQKKACGVDGFSQFTFDRPRFPFDLRGDQLGCQRRPHQSARSESKRAVQAGLTRQIQRPRA